MVRSCFPVVIAVLSRLRVLINALAFCSLLVKDVLFKVTLVFQQDRDIASRENVVQSVDLG